MARLGIEPQNPTDYTGIKHNIVPVVDGPREPTVNDTRYPLWTEWRVTANPVTGTEGDFWKLVAFSASDATWVRMATGTSAGVITLSDTGGTKVLSDGTGNIQLEGTTDEIIVTSDVGNNKLTFSLASSVSFFWKEDTTTSITMVANEGYISNNAGAVTSLLPATAAVGAVTGIINKGAGLVTITQASGQTIHFGNMDTTSGAGGSLATTAQWDTLTLVCTTADTDWAVAPGSGGNWTVT